MEITACNLEVLKNTVTRAGGRWDNDALAEFLCACQYDPVLKEIKAEIEYNRTLVRRESGESGRNK